MSCMKRRRTLESSRNGKETSRHIIDALENQRANSLANKQESKNSRPEQIREIPGYVFNPTMGRYFKLACNGEVETQLHDEIKLGPNAFVADNHFNNPSFKILRVIEERNLGYLRGVNAQRAIEFSFIASQLSRPASFNANSCPPVFVLAAAIADGFIAVGGIGIIIEKIQRSRNRRTILKPYILDSILRARITQITWNKWNGQLICSAIGNSNRGSYFKAFKMEGNCQFIQSQLLSEQNTFRALGWHSTDPICLLAGDGQNLLRFEARIGKLVSISLMPKDDIYALSWVPNTETVLLGSRKGFLSLVDYRSKSFSDAIPLSKMGMCIDHIEALTDGRTFLVSDKSGGFAMFDTRGTSEHIVKLYLPTRNSIVCPQRKQFAVSQPKNLAVISAQSEFHKGQCMHVIGLFDGKTTSHDLPVNDQSPHVCFASNFYSHVDSHPFEVWFSRFASTELYSIGI